MVSTKSFYGSSKKRNETGIVPADKDRDKGDFIKSSKEISVWSAIELGFERVVSEYLEICICELQYTMCYTMRAMISAQRSGTKM